MLVLGHEAVTVGVQGGEQLPGVGSPPVTGFGGEGRLQLLLVNGAAAVGVRGPEENSSCTILDGSGLDLPPQMDAMLWETPDESIPLIMTDSLVRGSRTEEKACRRGHPFLPVSGRQPRTHSGARNVKFREAG